VAKAETEIAVMIRRSLETRQETHGAHGQNSRLVDYAKRYRAGLRVGTSMTEGTANFLVNRRMNKAQQMRWSRRGADMLLQVRCAVYNGAFGDGFSTLFDPTSNTVQKLPGRLIPHILDSPL
jgi:hypothetical protein